MEKAATLSEQTQKVHQPALPTSNSWLHMRSPQAQPAQAPSLQHLTHAEVLFVATWLFNSRWSDRRLL